MNKPRDTKIIRSRYGEKRTIYKFRNHYIIEGESQYIRGGDDFIDFEGGPYLSKRAVVNFFGENVLITNITPMKSKTRFQARCSSL